MENRTGACLCGAVRYTLSGKLYPGVICHCSHCKKQSGSLFSLNFIVKESEYQQEGKTHVYIDSGDSGQLVYRHFCGDCGSPIFVKIAAVPGKLILKGGTLDSIPELPPQTEIYCSRASPWLPSLATTSRFEMNA